MNKTERGETDDMKKVVSKILVFVMVIASLQGINLNELMAADTNLYGFEMQKKILAEDSKGLELSNRIGTDYTETAVAKWDISSAADYVLTYYIEAMDNTTQKVELTLENAGDDNVTLSGKVYNQDGSTKSIDYVERVLNSGSNSWENKSKEIGKTEFTAGLKLGTYASTYQQYNVNLTNVNVAGKNLNIRLKLDGKLVYVYTTGISKGNINEFELKVDGTTQAKQSFFNGPKNFEIKPVHLKDNTLESIEVIEDLTKETPGSKPGVKLSFDQIKVLEGGKYTIPSSSTKLDEVVIKLQPQYSIGSSVQDGDDSIRLDFKAMTGEKIKIDTKDSSYTVGAVDTNGQINIYLANGTNLESSVIKWDVLEPSMVVDSLFTYGKDADIYKPENKGHTYLDYSLNKTTNNQVQFTIKPYNINSAATYTILSSNTEKGTFTARTTYEYDPNKTNNKEITTSISSTNVTYFKVKIKIDNNEYESQVVRYNPGDFSPVPTTPSIKNIDNVYVVPTNENSNISSAKAIGFDIEWFAPSNLKTLLNGGTLYYEMLIRKDKDDLDPLKSPHLAGTSGYAAYSKVFKVSLDPITNQIIVETDLGTAGQKDVTEENANKIIRYNESKGTFKMENVSLMNFSETTKDWEQIEIPEGYDYNTATKSLKESGAEAKDSLKDMVIPGNYYVSLRTVYVATDDTKRITYSNESNLVSVALDITKEVVPVPTTVVAEDASIDKTQVIEEITYSYVDIQAYVKKMLEPAELKLYTGTNKDERFSGEYEFYLYQNKDALKNNDPDKMDAMSLGSDAILNLADTTINSQSAIEVLKAGGVIPFKVHISSLIGIGQGKLKIKGLDSNTVYYLQLRTKLLPISETGPVSPRVSELSKVFTFTTTTEPMPPTPEDKVPPTPEKIWIEEQANNSSVTLGWAPAKFEEDEDIDLTYYEFIRTEKQLTKDEEKLSVEKLVQGNELNVGFRSDKDTARAENEPAYMSTYTYKNQIWTNLEPLQLSSKFQLYDDSLNPNNIYYYYVRTVCMVDGKPIKSKWIMVPVTTAPVQPPINLKVEAPKTYSHDTKREIVISFDAPVPADAKVPDEFAFDIAVKSELDDTYKLDYSAVKLTSVQDDKLTPEGYTHFVYKITGLKPNKRYDIKVRIVDKTKPLLESGNYPTSLYCDKVSTRTDYDEDEAEKDNKFEEYLKKFDSEAEKLRRRPYWVVEQGEIYKYRESYLKTEIGLQKEYALVAEENANSLYYYMPASVMIDESNTNTVLNVTIGNQTLNIRPYTLTSENTAIKTAIEKMASDEIEDYYVGIKFYTQKTTESINGQGALSPKLNVNMELVYMKQRDYLTEDDIMIALNDIIAEERNSFINKLEKEVYNGVIEEDVLNELITDSMADIEKDHARQVDKLMDRYIKRTVKIAELDKPLFIISEIDAFAADAYYYSNGWGNVESYQVGKGFGIEADKLGTYIFVGQADLANTVPSLGPYQSFIGKYGLTEFFKLDTYMIKTAATKEQVYGATARVLGAKKGTDYIVFLKNAGIKGVTSIGLSKNIRQDEAIYIMMQAYERLHNRKVSSIVIKNKQGVQNIGAFQSVYRTYVYAAVELKIVDNPNSRVLPSKEMTAEEIIKILYKVQAQ